MAACTACGETVGATMNYCPKCGEPVKPGAPARKVFLEDLYHHCERCGSESVFGRLTKCHACTDRVCGECIEVCGECDRPTCARCMLDCAQCDRTGCTTCFERCESCMSRAMCPDHALTCTDCGLATCEKCMKYCKNCEMDVCRVCLDEAHDKRKSARS